MLFRVPTLPTQYREVIARIEELRHQLRYSLMQRPKRWTGLLRRSTFARAIQGSNTIEGYNVTVDDAIAAVEGEEPLGNNREAWLAVTCYRDAMSYILQLADDPHYLHNEGTLKSLHYMMLKYEVSKYPGRWRPGAIFVRREPSGEIVYEGPDVELVASLMAELIESLNVPDHNPVIVRAAMAHLNLVMVHPFSDGNGRMARALQTFVLAREGILDPTFSSIEEYLGRNTEEYYAVLGAVGGGAWSPENDALPWIKFSLTAHYRQAETLLRRIQELEKLWILLEDKLKRRKMQERTIFALLDAAVGLRVRNATYRKMAEVSDQVASRDLHTLVENDLLEARGERRGRYYIAGEWLKNLRETARSKRTSTDPFTVIPTTRTKKPEQGRLV